jgi:hypothetical protein
MGIPSWLEHFLVYLAHANKAAKMAAVRIAGFQPAMVRQTNRMRTKPFMHNPVLKIACMGREQKEVHHECDQRKDVLGIPCVPALVA